MSPGPPPHPQDPHHVPRTPTLSPGPPPRSQDPHLVPFTAVAGSQPRAHDPDELFSPVMYCTDPGEVEHSTRLISDPVLLVGTTIQYTCNPGFVLEGSSLLTCYSRETGTPIWTSRLPHCVCKRAALGQLLLLPSPPRDLPCTETVPSHLQQCRVSPCGQAGCDPRSCLTALGLTRAVLFPSSRGVAGVRQPGTAGKRLPNTLQTPLPARRVPDLHVLRGLRAHGGGHHQVHPGPALALERPAAHLQR